MAITGAGRKGLRLSTLADEEIRLVGDGAVEVVGLAADSRHVQPGDLFAALPGTRVHGLAYLPEAKARGAVAVLVGEADEAKLNTDMPRLVAADPRRAFARLAARFYPGRPQFLAAVTGTNGKTSTVVFTRQIWQHCGLKAASLGTLGLEPEAIGERHGLTTPDALSLHRILDAVTRQGVSHLALEASSHGLDQRRLDGLAFEVAAFTNFSRDHLDYHPTLEAYFLAKARLFAELLRPDGTAVLNTDVPEFPRLAAIVAERGACVLTYGRKRADLQLVDCAAQAQGLRLTLLLKGRPHSLAVPLFGTFQAYNLLCAAGIALASGLAPDAVGSALAAVSGVRGRMQLVARTRSGGRVFVDYAHTPDALAQALRALREHVRGRIGVVFGCGGDRDAGKRPLMGAIAAQEADFVIVTDDNPRSEDPAAIRAQILAGAGPNARAIGDRAEAIGVGLAVLGPEDALLVAGKGHEAGQIIGNRVLPFADAEVIRALLADGRAQA